jgi:putative NADH-flavin reductase
MKLAVFGATGGSGRQVIQQALQLGHDVTALVRPGSASIEQPRLEVVTGQLSEPDVVRGVVHGRDAVVSALGINEKGRVSVCADGAAAIVSAMQAEGVCRLIAVSAHGASESRDGSLYCRLLWAVLPNKMRDKEVMEGILSAADLDWTIVRPSALTNRLGRGRYRAAVDMRMFVWSHVSRAELATFILDELATPRFVRQCPGVTG